MSENQEESNRQAVSPHTSKNYTYCMDSLKLLPMNHTCTQTMPVDPTTRIQTKHNEVLCMISQI